MVFRNLCEIELFMRSILHAEAFRMTCARYQCGVLTLLIHNHTNKSFIYVNHLSFGDYLNDRSGYFEKGSK